MNLTSRGKTYFTICSLALLFSYLIITLNFFPHLGFTFSLVLFALFIYKHIKQKQKTTNTYLTFALAFSVLLFVRSNPEITFLNLCAALFFGFLTLLPTQKNDFGFTDHIYAPFLFTIKSVLTRSEYFLEYTKENRNSKSIKIAEVVFGITLTLFLLALILPLLASTNPFFQKLVSDFWNFLQLERLIANIGYETLFVWLLRFTFFLFAVFIIPKVITLMNAGGKYSLPQLLKLESFPLNIPKFIVACVLTVFFVTQLQFYFADETTLNSLGLSYSQHTREVFAQMSLVAGIVLLLLHNDRKSSSFNKVVNPVLGVQGIFLTLMAYKSDLDYINAWGLTHLRLWGLTFATLITGLFVLFFKNVRQNNAAVVFVNTAIVFSGILLLVVNILNFDYLIYHFKKAATGQGIDYTYLSTLSPDSLSYADQFTMLKAMTAKVGYSLTSYDNKNPLIILYKIEYLQNKYSKFDLRTLNLLDFWQYQKIKSINTSELRTYYENKLQHSNYNYVY